MNYTDFSAILVAAGLSSRMGAVNKLLLPVNGQPMVRHSAKLYLDLGISVCVVLGFEADKVGAALDGLDVACVHNRIFETGQQSSVRAGLDHIQLPKAGLFIALADQPFLQGQDIADMCDAFLQSAQDKIFLPDFNGQRGNPILFPGPLVSQIRAQGRVPGCRKFIADHPELVRAFPAPNPHFTTDIDTLQDAENLLNTALT